MKAILSTHAVALLATASIVSAALFRTAPAEADLLTPADAFASTYYTVGQGPLNLINDLGLDTSSGDVLTYTHATDDGAEGMWHAGEGQDIGGAAPVVADQYLVFDLGSNYDLSAAYLWQMVQTADEFHWQRGINEFRLLASPDAPDPADVANPPADYDTTGFTEILALSELAIEDFATPAPPATTQVFSLTDATNVRQVYLEVVSAHSGLTNEYVGLSEVKFEGTLVPEPNAIWLAMLGSGLAIGLARTARRAISAKIVS